MAKIHKSNVVQIETTKPIIIHIPNIKVNEKKETSFDADLSVVNAVEDATIRNDEPIIDYKNLIEEELERAKNDGFQQGYNDGIEKGLSIADDMIENKLSELRNNFEVIITKFGQEKENLFTSWKESLLQLSVDIAEKIINKELDRNDEYFHSIVNKAVSSLDGDNKITLMVSEEDYNKYFDTNDIDYKTRKGIIKVKVEIDPVMKQGDCIIQTENGYIDCGVYTQLNKIKRSLEEGK